MEAKGASGMSGGAAALSDRMIWVAARPDNSGFVYMLHK